MKNFIQPGNVITVTAPAGGVLSGAGLLVGSLFGIANGNAAENEDVELSITGVYAIGKTSAQAWTVGAKIYWDNATKLATTAAAAGANALIGVATKAAANPSAEGEVRLNGSFTI